jgi:8-oxo-dGTP pyrophosphatase MutT (NUDIX family)
MASSRFPTRQFPSEQFVECCGAIVFNLTDERICLCNLLSNSEWVLPKGRRNIDESRKDAALREVYEETGYRCHLLPVTMATRATRSGDEADVRDEQRVLDDLIEPFMCTVRELGDRNGGGIKIIWWFVGVLDSNEERGSGEEMFRSEWFAYDEAVLKLSFELDRNVVRKAAGVVRDTLARRPFAVS